MKRVSKLQKQIIELLSEANTDGNHLYSSLDIQSFSGASQPSVSRSLKTMMNADLIVKEIHIVDHWAWAYVYQLKKFSDLEKQQAERRGLSVDMIRQHYKWMKDAGVAINYETGGKQ